MLTSEEAHKIQSEWVGNLPKQWIEYALDGCKEFVEIIIASMDVSLSLILWNILISIIKSYCSFGQSFDSILGGMYTYLYQSKQSDKRFDSNEIIRLRTKPWLFNSDGGFLSANQLTIRTLSADYDTQSTEAQELLRFLAISDGNDLTDEQREKIALANELADIPPEELKKIAEEYRAKQRRAESDISIDDDISDSDNDTVDTDVDDEDIDGEEVSKRHTTARRERKERNTRQPTEQDRTEERRTDDDEEILRHPAVTRVAKEVSKQAILRHSQQESSSTADDSDPADSDEDEYTNSQVNYDKKIEQAKRRSADEINKIVQLEELTHQAANCKKYKFGWFKVLLKLEELASGENNANSREISISFAKAEHKSDTARMLILKHPNRYIPQSMEDLADTGQKHLKPWG